MKHGGSILGWLAAYIAAKIARKKIESKIKEKISDKIQEATLKRKLRDRAEIAITHLRAIKEIAEIKGLKEEDMYSEKGFFLTVISGPDGTSVGSLMKSGKVDEGRRTALSIFSTIAFLSEEELKEKTVFKYLTGLARHYEGVPAPNRDDAIFVHSTATVLRAYLSNPSPPAAEILNYTKERVKQALQLPPQYWCELPSLISGIGALALYGPDLLELEEALPEARRPWFDRTSKLGSLMLMSLYGLLVLPAQRLLKDSERMRNILDKIGMEMIPERLMPVSLPPARQGGTMPMPEPTHAVRPALPEVRPPPRPQIAEELPDMIPSIAKCRIEAVPGVQLGIYVDPEVVPRGRKSFVHVIVQNSLDVPVRGAISIEVPAKKFYKKTFLSTVRWPLGFDLGPAEVMEFKIPVQTTPKTPEGDYDIKIKVVAQSLGKGRRIRYQGDYVVSDKATVRLKVRGTGPPDLLPSQPEKRLLFSPSSS